MRTQRLLPLRLCTDPGCEFFGRHFENCQGCFGFGVRLGAIVDGNPVPVGAEEAQDPTLPPPDKCPVCGSDARGAPAG